MENARGAGTSGLIIGKFLPPHLGHQYLVDFARNYVDELTVLVCSIRSEPIPGEVRYAWMKEMFPDVNVVHVTDENPQEPKDHPDFWNIWKASINNALPQGADYLFASEEYGKKLAEVVGMKYVPVDPLRESVPISGTEIRADPIANWEYLPPVVRPHYVKKICVFGPESTGKSTLTKKLAGRFKTAYSTEYGRTYLDSKDGKCEYEDFDLIAKGKMASEDAMARQANRILFCDTDLITTAIWSDILFGKCPEWISKEANARKYDLYLLLSDKDVPFVPDRQRYLPDRRQLSFERCIKELEKRHRKYVVIEGAWDERFEKASGAVEDFLKANRRSVK